MFYKIYDARRNSPFYIYTLHFISMEMELVKLTGYGCYRGGEGNSIALFFNPWSAYHWWHTYCRGSVGFNSRNRPIYHNRKKVIR